MSPVHGGQINRLWADFQRIFSEFAGVSVQAFDERGSVFQPPPDLPPLCTYLQRFPETGAACQNDCFRKAATCRDTCKPLVARCYAGLSYHVVPLRSRGRHRAVIVVGRVLNEVSGGEQYQGFIERYKLSRRAFLESLAGVQAFSGSELERVASFVERLAISFLSAGDRFRLHRALLERRRSLIDLAGQAISLTDGGPGQERAMLERLCGTLSLSGAALLINETGRTSVQTSVGLGEEVLHALAGQDWPGLFRQPDGPAQLSFSAREELLAAGIGAIDPPLVVQRLAHGPRTVGYLVAVGRMLSSGDRDYLEAAAAFFAARLVHASCRERAERSDEESRLLGLMAEKCLSAHSVAELLPLALESAMHCLHAGRGSILLAEERGRITAHALRGPHAPLSGTITSLQPGTVSHDVFFNRRPRLVEDVEREHGFRRERQYPYGKRSFVSVPLKDNGRTLGVLQLTEREGEEAFSERDLELLERLSRQASGAIRKVRLEEEVETLRVTSTTDHLTGAHNRRSLEEHLGIEFQRARRFGQPLAVAMLDIDDFKALNDEMGHDYGDAVLKTAAAAMRRQLRSVDYLARYGGDEFVLILPGTDAAGALKTVEKIRSRISSTTVPVERPASRQPGLSVSAGVAVFPDAMDAPEELLRRADQALYKAKKSGRNSAQLWIH